MLICDQKDVSVDAVATAESTQEASMSILTLTVELTRSDPATKLGIDVDTRDNSTLVTRRTNEGLLQT